MPCILKIRVVEARDLPVMDRSSELTDAYVENKSNSACPPAFIVKFSQRYLAKKVLVLLRAFLKQYLGQKLKYADNEPQRTEVCRKTLNPHWNQDFRFEVPNDSLLQDEPLELKVFDYDIVSSNDIIGVVYIDLNGLLMEGSPGQVSGWFPIYDNLRGIRGYLYVLTKLESFLDENPFKDASTGVQFFSVDTPFSVYRISQIYGFVEELIVEDDPEHHWSDTFRASRISNYERQLLLYQLSGRLRRQLGCKVLELGGNSVLGYRQHFDLEGNSGIVVRGYGTACRLKKLKLDALASTGPAKNIDEDDGNSDNEDTHATSSLNNSSLNIPIAYGSDKGSKGVSPTLSPKAGARPKTPPLPNTPPTILLDPLPEEVAEGVDLPTTTPQAPSDVKLLTLSSFQANLVVHIGGVVSARSVKMLSTRRSDMREIRDAWWVEIRNEIKAHARALGCPHVVGYTETTSIQPNDDLCVLSATGTAAVLDLHGHKMPKWKPVDKEDGAPTSTRIFPHTTVHTTPSLGAQYHGTPRKRKPRPACSFMHIPYSYNDAPFPMRLVACGMCHRKYVPEVLLSSIEPPPGLPITGRGLLIEARVCRAKKRVQGEANASIVSDAIPFLEYHLHRQLLYKMKVLGMNAVFGLRLQTTVGESQIVGIAAATAVFVPALPPPPVLHINRRFDVEDQSLLQIQHRIEKISRINANSLQHAASMQQPDTFARYFPDAPSPHIPLPLGKPRRDASRRAKKREVLPAAAGVSSDDEESDSFSVSNSSSYTDSDDTSYGSEDDDFEKEAKKRKEKRPLKDDKNRGESGKRTKDTVDNSTTKEESSVTRNSPKVGDGETSPPELVAHNNSSGDPDSDLSDNASDDTNKDKHTKHRRKKVHKGAKELSNSSFSSKSDSETDSIKQNKAAIESAYIVEVDDEIDEDTMAVLLDPVLPMGVALCNTETLPGASRPIANLQFVTALRRVEWDISSGHLNQKLSALFNHLYASIVFKLRDLVPCSISALRVDVQLPEENQVQLLATAMCVTEDPLTQTPTIPSFSIALNQQNQTQNPPQIQPQIQALSQSQIQPLPPSQAQSQSQTPSQFQLQPQVLNLPPTEIHPIPIKEKEDQNELQFDMSPPISPSKLKSHSVDMPLGPKTPQQVEVTSNSFDKHHVELTPLSFVPGMQMDKYVGHMHIHFIKESFAVREDGGLGSFTHVFLTEANVIAKSHVTALGGNALVGYRIETFLIVENSAKDQAYSLISISGDAYHVKPQPNQFRKNLLL